MKDIDYRKLSAELDLVLEKLQAADVDIDDAVKHYQRGLEIVKQLEAYLKTAENKVIKVQAKFAE